MMRASLMVVLLASPSAALSQQPQPLGRPNAEFSEPFSRISGIRELADGRLIVTDSREQALQLIDLRGGTAQRIGREGRGPNEFLSAGALVPMPGDHTLLVDHGNRRFLRIGPDGALLGTISLPTLPGPESHPGAAPMPPGIASLGLLPPRGVDQWGRLYFHRVSLEVPGIRPADSTAIMRWVVGAAGVDSVDWIPVSSSMQVWAPAQEWRVLPDGRGVHAIPNPYRIILVDSTGRRTSGPVVPYTPIRVSESDRQAQRDMQQSRMSQMSAMAGQAMRVPALEFADVKPPFHGSGSVSVAPDGQLWILRTRAFDDPLPVYDVFDQTGTLVRQVSLDPGARLVGFGRGVIYVTRIDDDDLEYLQRFERPGSGR